MYKRQGLVHMLSREGGSPLNRFSTDGSGIAATPVAAGNTLVCLLYTSDAADERSSVDLGGRRIIKKKKRVR